MELFSVAPEISRYREAAAGEVPRPFFVCVAAFIPWMFLGLVLGLGFSQAYAEDYAHSSAEALVAGDQSERLADTIEAYARIRDAGGWPVLGEGPTLAAGNRHADVRTLRSRLRITGDYDAEMGADPLLFDIHLVEALQRFQQRHGIRASGVLGQQTRNALSFTVEQRIEQLEQARTEWTQFAAEKGPRLWVNIPEATVVALSDGQIAFEMRAIVGHPSRPTPVLSSSVRKVIVNPTWTVPKLIAVNDLVPRQRSDSNYFARSHIRVFDGWEEGAAELDPKEIDWSQVSSGRFPYRLRQDAGPSNSLGRLKFEFPNEYNVYLHDTPVRAALGLSYRTLSSGCIRVENPEVLAEWMVPENSRARLNRLLSAKDYSPRAIFLERPVSIDLVYLTAWVAPADGTVQFRQDIYARAETSDSIAAR